MKIFNRIYYGWIIVFASVLLSAVAMGMFFSTNSLFVKPVCDTFGFLRGEFTFHRTIITLTGALLMPVYGRFIHKIGVKKVMLACVSTLPLIIIGYSIATSLWHFYILAFFNGMFVSGISFMSIGVLISSWYHGKQGLPLGLAFSGSGLGGAISIPIVAGIIERFGWQTAYQIMGVSGLAIMLPVVLFLVKNTPEEMGLEPFASHEFKSATNHGISVDLTLSEAIMTGKFWLLISAFFLITFFAAATNTHTAPYLSDLGYSTIFVSSVVALFMITLTLGKIILGLIYDRFGVATAHLILYVCFLTFPIFALLSYIPAMAWLYAASMGFASCAVSITTPILIKRYFGDKGFASIFSFCSMISTFAASASVPFMGVIFDMTGSYRPAWILFLILSVFISAFLFITEILHRKPMQKTDSLASNE